MSIVRQPRTELMCTPKALNPSVAWLKHPGSAASRLQRPMRHAEGNGRNRQRIAAREIVGGICPLKKIDEPSRVAWSWGNAGLWLRLFTRLTRLYLRICINK